LTELNWYQGNNIEFDSSKFSSFGIDPSVTLPYPELITLEFIGCDSCVDTDNDNDGLPDFSEYGQFSVNFDNESHLINYSFKGGFAVDPTGKLEDTCASETAVRESVCSGGKAISQEINCPNNYNCVHPFPCVILHHY